MHPDLEADYVQKAFRFFHIGFSVVNNHRMEALYEWKGFRTTPCWLLQNPKERHTLQFRIKPERTPCWLLQNPKERHTLQFRIKPERAIEVLRLFPRWRVQ